MHPYKTVYIYIYVYIHIYRSPREPRPQAVIAALLNRKMPEDLSHIRALKDRCRLGVSREQGDMIPLDISLFPYNNPNISPILM